MVRKSSRSAMRLAVEKLEDRAMMSGDGIAPTNPLGGADFVNLAAAAAAANLISMNAANQNVAPLVSTIVAGVSLTAPIPGSNSFDATTGVGQMLITTGANTLGISGFATPIAGFGSVHGGKSGA